MKKLFIFAFAILLVAVFTLPAAALENEFGGYWRTRFYMNKDFSGSDATGYDEALDFSWVDTRTRLYYTAILNDNLRFVNKFEWDGTWGNGDYGDIGADAKGTLEIKNSYASMTAGILKANVGVQGATIARGFFFADDFSGAILNFQTDTFEVPLYWIRADEGGIGKDANDGDLDYFGVAPIFNAGPVKINPMLFWLTTQDASKGSNLNTIDPDGINLDLNGGDIEALNAYFLGVNADATIGPANVWFTGIYETGKAEAANSGDSDLDLNGFLVALGGSANFGMVEAHGQVFYASGDDGNDDNELNAFYVPTGGQSYYWSEIMGYGTFDQQVSYGSPADKISNIMAIGVGAMVSPMEKLGLGLDIWYAQLAEDKDLQGNDVDDDLGTEVDFTVNYALLEDLDLKVVAAYLFAGDGTNPQADNEDGVNPFELGAQLSLSF
jgi:hypothetical protein